MSQTISGIRREVPHTQKKEDTCYHCGAAFDEVIIHAHQHSFCCEGCKTVYEILHVNGLDHYYTIENSPGIKTGKLLDSKYQFLDNQEVKSTLLDFSEGDTETVTFFVPKIHCSSCIWLLENLPLLNKAITNSRVNFLKKEVHVVYNSGAISLRKVVELMVSVGYEPAINLNGGKNAPQKKYKSDLIKLGVAGFSFGNIMMLSLPDYFDQFEGLTLAFKNLFGYLNLLLALPVLLYSSSDYFSSAFKSVKRGVVNVDLPISIGILTLFMRSTYEIVSGSGTGFMDSFTMFVFLLLVGKWYQNRTYQALSFERDYTSYFPIAITRVSAQGEPEVVSVKEVVVNDVLTIKNQEIIPCDGILLSSEASIDYSFVTGEADHVKKELNDTVYAGGKQLGASIQVQVTKAISQSYLTSLWNQEAFTKQESPYASIVDRTSRYFTYFVLLVALMALIFWWGSGVGQALRVFTSVLIIACPCALALTLPFALGTTMSVFGKFSFYLKNTEVVEKLSAINTIVFDKTGTLTQSTQSEVHFVGSINAAQLQEIGTICEHSMHPLSQAIAASISDKRSLRMAGFEELPGKGIIASWDGHEVKLGAKDWIASKMSVTDDLASRVFVAYDGQVLGYFVVRKEYRNGVKNLIHTLRDSGIKPHLLSGDNAAEMQNLAPLFASSNLHFNQTPASKLTYISQLQKAGMNVLMVGDGLNDAGALKQANVGVSVSDDVYNFTPASDAILNAANLPHLLDFKRYADYTMKVIRVSFGISITYNTIGMACALMGWVTPLFAAILMPISSISVVSFIVFAIKYWHPFSVSKS